jgi:hypothetical protein
MFRDYGEALKFVALLFVLCGVAWALVVGAVVLVATYPLASIRIASLAMAIGSATIIAGDYRNWRPVGKVYLVSFGMACAVLAADAGGLL